MSSKKRLIKHPVPVYINNDVAALRARLSHDIRRRKDISGTHLANKKLILYVVVGSQKTVIEDLFDLHKWDPNFLLPLCNERLHF